MLRDLRKLEFSEAPGLGDIRLSLVLGFRAQGSGHELPWDWELLY